MNVCVLPLQPPNLPVRFRPTQAIGRTSASLVRGGEAAPRLTTLRGRSFRHERTAQFDSELPFAASPWAPFSGHDRATRWLVGVAELCAALTIGSISRAVGG